MTFFGFLWIIILIYCFPNVKRMTTITIVSAVLQCSNVFEFAGIGIGPQIITSILFILRMIFTNDGLKLRTKTKGFDIEIYMLIFMMVIMISSIVNSVFLSCFLKIAQLTIYMLCFHFMLKSGKYIDENYIYNLIRTMSIVLMIIGFVQLGITSGLLPGRSIIKYLLYNDTISNYIYFNLSNYKRVLSTYMEPSYYAGFIVGAFYYLLSVKDKRKENYWLLGLLGLQLILTFSSTAYGAFFIVGILFLASSRELKLKLRIIVLGVIGFAILYFFFYNVLDTVIFSKGLTSSANTRYWWNHNAFVMYQNSPIIGNGYKTSRGSSIIYTILAEFGIIGLVSYVILNGRLILLYIVKKNKFELGTTAISLLSGVIAVVASQIIAVPDLDICTYWMWLNLFALGMTCAKNEKLNMKVLVK